MLKEFFISRFETYLLDEEPYELEVQTDEMLAEQELLQQEYPPGFFSSL